LDFLDRARKGGDHVRKASPRDEVAAAGSES
jgi:hypothetical protein